MKRQKTLYLLIGILFLVSSTWGMEISLKIGGGVRFFSPDDVNRVLSDWVEWQRREADSRNTWTFLDAKVPEFSYGMEFEGELFFTFSSLWALSVGTGFFYSDLEPTKTEVRIDKPLGETILVQPRTISALPLTLSGYFLYPLSRLFRIYVKGSVGHAWAKYIEREGSRRITNEKFTYNYEMSSKGSGPIYGGALGIWLETEPGIRFFLETGMQWAKMKGFKGEMDSGETGNLYFFEEYDSKHDFWQAKNRLMTEAPSGPEFRSVQETRIDLSGISIKLGIMIRF